MGGRSDSCLRFGLTRTHTRWIPWPCSARTRVRTAAPAAAGTAAPAAAGTAAPAAAGTEVAAGTGVPLVVAGAAASPVFMKTATNRFEHELRTIAIIRERTNPNCTKEEENKGAEQALEPHLAHGAGLIVPEGERRRVARVAGAATRGLRENRLQLLKRPAARDKLALRRRVRRVAAVLRAHWLALGEMAVTQGQRRHVARVARAPAPRGLRGAAAAKPAAEPTVATAGTAVAAVAAALRSASMAVLLRRDLDVAPVLLALLHGGHVGGVPGEGHARATAGRGQHAAGPAVRDNVTAVLIGPRGVGVAGHGEDVVWRGGRGEWRNKHDAGVRKCHDAPWAIVPRKLFAWIDAGGRFTFKPTWSCSFVFIVERCA